MKSFDCVLVGGGLQNGLCALSILAARPEARLALVERGLRLGGDHTWSFHAGDIPADVAHVVAPLVIASWDAYDVAFPGLTRTIEERYATTTGDALDAVLRARLAGADAALHLGRSATAIAPGHVTLDSGVELRAPLVIDARGPEPARPTEGVGWQKFVGLELELAEPSPFVRPMLMDATVEQLDGFRFLYVLPYTPHHVLVEDTVYSDNPALDDEAFAARVLTYARERGLVVKSVRRRERGVLAIPWRQGLDAGDAIDVSADGTLIRGGYRGGWFHPTTGYSFPPASRLAACVAATPPDQLRDAVTALARQHRRQAGFARLLNRLLFTRFAPGDRRNVLERFHKLPAATIRRFYSLESTTADRARILCGRPPRGMTLRRHVAAPEAT
jgi:lycopene beta-cyclase